MKISGLASSIIALTMALFTVCANAQTDTPAITPIGDYTYCGQEPGVCSLPSGSGYSVGYGADDSYITLDFAGGVSVPCTLQTFGADPDYGVVKSCYYYPMPPAIPNGSYILVNKATHFVMDVSRVSKSAGAQVWQWSPVVFANQQWRLENSGNGTYTLQSINSGLFLDNSGDEGVGGTVIQQIAKPGNNNQLWKLTPTADGSYTLTNAGSTLPLTGITGGLGSEILQQQASTGQTSQEWTLQPTFDQAAASDEVEYSDQESPVNPQDLSITNDQVPLPDGVYTIHNYAGGQLLDDYEASTSSGAVVYGNPPLGGVNQQWLVTNNGENLYTIVNAEGGRALDSNLQQSSNGGPQFDLQDIESGNWLWKITANLDGSYSLINQATNLQLALVDAAITNNSPIVLQPPNSYPLAEWVFQPLYAAK